jgi:hypothetical protein
LKHFSKGSLAFHRSYSTSSYRSVEVPKQEASVLEEVPIKKQQQVVPIVTELDLEEQLSTVTV